MMNIVYKMNVFWVPDPQNVMVQEWLKHLVQIKQFVIQKPVWPIGYPKSGASGELVVEPSDNRPRRRSRQTKLDGYLAKAASFNQSNTDQIPLITLNAKECNSNDSTTSRQVPSTRRNNPKFAAIDSDSDGSV